MSPAEELEIKTQLYWDLSHHLHGPKNPSKKAPTASLALAACREVIDHLNPTRPLLRRVLTIQDTIIMGGSKKKKSIKTNNILKLRKVE